MPELVDAAKFAIGIAFLVVGAALVVRRGRGFDQKRQAGVLLVVAGLVFVAIGFGLVGG